MENKMKNNSIEYVLAGDYYIPNLKLPNEERTIATKISSEGVNLDKQAFNAS